MSDRGKMPDILAKMGDGKKQTSSATDYSLIGRIKNPADLRAWDEFVQIYRPLVYRLARARGMQDADAEDLTQKVLLSVADAIPTWQTSDANGRFRHWLRKVAKNALINQLTRQPRDRAVGGSSANRILLEHTGPLNTDDEIEWEYRRQVFRRAAEMVRQRADESTWRAFALTMIDNESISDTARQLGVSEGVVYASRSRIMRRLRDAVRQLEEDLQ